MKYLLLIVLLGSGCLFGGGTAPEVDDDTGTVSDGGGEGDAGSGCAQGLTDCGGECVELTNDPLNCGRCGNVCSPPTDANLVACQVGACSYQCNAGRSDENGDINLESSDGCESACIPIGPDEVNCDGADDNCDGQTDEGLKADYWSDEDADGFGAGPVQSSCLPPGESWIVVGDEDCDDVDDSVNPGIPEVCDGIDNDCLDGIDNGFEAVLDCGAGVCSGTDVACEEPTYVEYQSRFDDAICPESYLSQNVAQYEVVETTCGDGLDNDCDGVMDCDDDDCADACHGVMFTTSLSYDHVNIGVLTCSDIANAGGDLTAGSYDWTTFARFGPGNVMDLVVPQIRIYNSRAGIGNGDLVAGVGALFDNMMDLGEAIDHDEVGQPVTGEGLTFTGFNADGSSAPNCDGWSGAMNGFGQTGRSKNKGNTWANDGQRNCGNMPRMRVYCLGVPKVFSATN